MFTTPVQIISDESYVSGQIHDELVRIFSNADIVVKQTRGPSGDKGGIFWSDVHAVLLGVAGNVLWDVVKALGRPGVAKLIKVYKQTIRRRYDYTEFQPPFYIMTDLDNGLKTYFSIDSFDYEQGKRIDDEAALEKMVQDIPATRDLLNNKFDDNTLSLLADPSSIVMRYDFVLKKWVVRHYNSLASVFFDEMPPHPPEPRRRSLLKSFADWMMQHC